MLVIHFKLVSCVPSYLWLLFSQVSARALYHFLDLRTTHVLWFHPSSVVFVHILGVTFLPSYAGFSIPLRCNKATCPRFWIPSFVFTHLMPVRRAAIWVGVEVSRAPEPEFIMAHFR